MTREPKHTRAERQSNFCQRRIQFLTETLKIIARDIEWNRCAACHSYDDERRNLNLFRPDTSRIYLRAA